MIKKISSVRTSTLEIAYEECGPDADPVVLLHGWPDDVRTWDNVVEELVKAGYRTIAPYHRGFGQTRFLSESDLRSGQLTALGQDVMEFVDCLGLNHFTLVGHDWGARAAYIVAALSPERVRGLVTISVGYGTNDPGQKVSFVQARQYWYQWYLNLDRGRTALETDRKALCRWLWETWSPSWHFDDKTFEATAASWENPDWVEVTLHSYRYRWGNATGDSRYGDLETHMSGLPPIRVPSTVLHGAEDGATLPETSANKEQFFVGGYEYVVVTGVGHFVQRERPGVVVDAILKRACVPGRDHPPSPSLSL